MWRNIYKENANNYIAARRDLDQIYRNNGSFIVSVFDSTIDIGFVQLRNERKLFVQIRTVLANNTNHTINICGGTCDIITARNSTQYECVYCEDKAREFSNNPSIIKTVPISFSSGTELQKSLYFLISAESAEILRKSNWNGINFRLGLICSMLTETNIPLSRVKFRCAFMGMPVSYRSQYGHGERS